MELLMKDLGTLGKILPRILLSQELEFLMEDLGPLGKTLPRKEYPPPTMELLMEDPVQGTLDNTLSRIPPQNWNFSWRTYGLWDTNLAMYSPFPDTVSLFQVSIHIFDKLFYSSIYRRMGTVSDLLLYQSRSTGRRSSVDSTSHSWSSVCTFEVTVVFYFFGDS